MDIATLKRITPKPPYRGKYDKSVDGGGVTDLTPIAPESAASASTTLLIKTKMMIGTLGATSGSLMDTSGNLVWDINAKLFTTSGRRIVMDAAKKNLGQMKRMHMKTPGIHDIWYIGPMDDIKKCSVRCTSDRQMSKHRHSFAANIVKGETVIGDCDVRFLDREGKINLGGKLAATITRKTDMIDTDLQLDKHYWYALKVEPGVDQVFMVLVLMGLNEISEEHPDAFM